MKNVILILLSFTLVLCGCPQNPPVPPGPDADAFAPPPPPTPDDAGPTPVVDAAPTPPPVVDAAPTPPAPPDAGPVTADCTAACAALKAAGCSLGEPADCPAFLTRDLGTGHVTNKSNSKPLTCADTKKVTSKAGAQALGFVCK
jgi:hypothetical protein